jgi:hypothetical protein
LGDRHATVAVPRFFSHFSYNVTGFALRGLNSEAGVLIEGPASDSVFSDVRQHIDEVYSQAIQYDPSMKEAYAWWTREYFTALRTEANDAPRDSDSIRTIVILAAHSHGLIPKLDDIIYFEISEALREIRSLDTQVHLHLFEKLPTSPRDALSQIHNATTSLSCQTEGLEVGGGGLELNADWSIDNSRSPDLKKTKRPFRPTTTHGMQQVRVRVDGPLKDRFDYLFDAGKNTWFPEFDDDNTMKLPTEAGKTWLRVIGLSESNAEISGLEKMALIEASPESGSFILFSRRRRKLGKLPKT